MLTVEKKTTGVVVEINSAIVNPFIVEMPTSSVMLPTAVLTLFATKELVKSCSKLLTVLTNCGGVTELINWSIVKPLIVETYRSCWMPAVVVLMLVACTVLNWAVLNCACGDCMKLVVILAIFAEFP